MPTQWIRSNAIVWEELNDEVLLVSPASGRRWTLNATAAAIWKLCDGHAGLSELAQLCSKNSHREIAEFCRIFAELGLLIQSNERKRISVTSGSTACMSAHSTPPNFRELALLGTPRRRPSPRGNSGPG